MNFKRLSEFVFEKNEILTFPTDMIHRMESLYVLQLETGKYYVGKSENPERRFRQHMDGYGSVWTKKYKPVKIVERRPLNGEFDETNTTKLYMKKYGIHNVRGGAYCQIELPDGIEDVIRHELRDSSDKCFKCGRAGHYANKCPNGVEGDKKIVICGDCDKQFVSDYAFNKHYCNPQPRSGKCYRCGRAGHYSPDCYARTHVNGSYIDDSD